MTAIRVVKAHDADVRARHRVDFDVGVPQDNEFFGPLMPHLRGRHVLIEHHSRPPDWRLAHREVAKALLRYDQQAPVLQNAHGPVLLVLCRRGIGGYRTLRLSQDARYPGVSWAAIGRMDVLVLDAARLPPLQGFSLIRFALAPPNQTHQARLAELLGDPHVSTLTKNRLLEAVVHNHIEVPNVERVSILDRLRDEGRAAGREEGRAAGREEGRAALLDLAAPLGLPLEELRAIDSLDELTARIKAAVAAR